MKATLKPLIKKFMPFAQKKMGFNKPAKILFRDDANNAKDPLGKTAYYDPAGMSITLYITNRHPKDVMRSLSHELIHHTQNCNGQFEHTSEMGEGYAQKDEHLREMEREAYEQGNLIFRDWEDGIKNTIYYESLQGVKNKMSIKEWKNGEIKTLLTEAWGFQMDLSKLNENTEENEEELEEGGPMGHFSSDGNIGDALSTDDLFKLMDAGYGPDDLRGLNYSNLTPEMASVLGTGGAMGRPPMEEVVGGVTGASGAARRSPHKRTPVPETDEEDKEEIEEVFGGVAGTAGEQARRPHKRTPVPDTDKDEEEELDEGGAANRIGNEDKDVAKGRMHADRVHEEQDSEELEETGLADRPENAAQAKAGRGGKDRYKRIGETQIKEILRKAIAMASSTKGD